MTQTTPRVCSPLNFFFVTALVFSVVFAANSLASSPIPARQNSHGSPDNTKTILAPTNVKCYPCEKHLDLTWDAVDDPNLAGYRLYKWDGENWNLTSQVDHAKNYFIEFVNATGYIASYRVSAYDIYGNESALSDSATATTRAMSDDEFLDMVQRSTFRYFWNYGHPVSGLSRERLNSGNTVTSGGSGFGLMALLVGIERGYITRQAGVQRYLQILNFLSTKAQRYHGVFPHWLNGETGVTIPFSQYDNGGDLVETGYLLQGLLTARQYFTANDTNEAKIRELITAIWQSTEFSWYRRSPYSNVLYWHWSSDYAWQMNMPITGWSEPMICYLLGVASPTYPIPASMYYKGWAGNSNYANSNTYYGYRQYVGEAYGGPLFFVQYSFLGFDPRDKKDKYANYFINNRNTTLINRAYCAVNPKGFAGYNENCWGLTASDNPSGYSAQAPYSNDNGTITPTAALSSMPYTPKESLDALKYFYRTYGNKLWGEYGFKDAFNIGSNWFASSYLAIDQGPIIVMIENYRSQLLWNKFMANPEIKPMLDSIGFTYDPSAVTEKNELPKSFKLMGNYPNPFNPGTVIEFALPRAMNVSVTVFNAIGQQMTIIDSNFMQAGKQSVHWNGVDQRGNPAASGVYFYKIRAGESLLSGKMILQR